MVTEIIWTNRATSDLKNIINYYTAFSVTYAQNIFDNIYSGVNYLSENPYLGFATSYKNLRSKTVLKRYSIIYQLGDISNQLTIYRIWDNRRNPINKFKDL